MLDRKYKVAGTMHTYDGSCADENKSTRVSFAWSEDDRDVIVQELGDTRPMSVFLRETGRGYIDYADCIHGTFDESNIILCVGTDYAQVPMYRIDKNIFVDLHAHINKVYGYSGREIAIWSGYEVGEIGVKWRPMKLIGCLCADSTVDLF